MSSSKEKFHSPARKKRSHTAEAQALQNPQLFRLIESGLDLQMAQDVQTYGMGGGEGSLKIGAVDSPMEMEADRMADRILSGQTEVQPQLKTESISRVPDGEDEEPPRMEVVMGKMEIYRYGAGDLSTPSGFESKLAGRQGLGSPLQGNLKTQMEGGFGSDLSHVRLHTDSQADQMSRDIGAKAFTYGQDIYFKGGAYDPGSSGGQRLIAHELTHTFQQSGSVAAKRIQRVPDEPKKYDLDYGKLTEQNLYYWKYYIRNFNPFGHLDIYPYQKPAAYINKTYEFQQKLNAEWSKEEKVEENGLFNWDMFMKLRSIGELSAQNESHYQWFIKRFDKEIVDKAKAKFGYETGQPELISSWFRENSVFDFIRRYSFMSIKKHDKGPHVKRLQKALMVLNYPLPVYQDDGKFGQESVDALKDFQRDEDFAPAEITGVLNAKTLQRLDVRMYGKKYAPEYHGGGELARLYHVPVPHYMPKDDFLVHAFMYIFEISEAEARVLRNDNWSIINYETNKYREVSPSEVEVGHRDVHCRVSLLESIKGRRIRNRPSRGQKVDAMSADEAFVSLEEMILTLNERGHIFALIKDVESKKSIYESYKRYEDSRQGRIDGAGGFGLSEEAKKKWDAAQAKLDAELDKYGITKGQIEGQKSRFQKLFTSYAHHVARKMLEDNRTSVNIEMMRYDSLNTEDGQEKKYISDVKSILKKLDQGYKDADQLWWDGLSLAETGDKNKINSQKKLRDHAGPIEARGKVTFHDPAEEIKKKYYAYKPEKLAESAPNDEFTKGIEKEKEMMRFLSEKAQIYQILAFPDLKLRLKAGTYAKKSDEDLRKFLYDTLNTPKATDGILQKIAQTERALNKDHDLIYSMGPVIAKAEEELGIFPGSYPDKFIKEMIEAHNNKTFWESLGMAALGIGLGLLALVSGPVGWVALAGSIAVGVYDSYNQYQQISTAKAAKRSAMDPRKALGETDPSYFWFYVSVLSIGLDVFDAVKLLKPTKLAIDAAQAGDDLAKGLTKALQEEQAALEALAKGKSGAEAAEIGTKIAKIKKAIADIDPDELAKNFDILRHVSKSPRASLALAEGLQQPEIAQAFAKLRKLQEAGKVAEDAYIHIIRYFGGIGQRYMHELPEILRLAEAGGLVANKQLFRELMSDSRLQKVLLDNNHNPALLLTEWKAWKAASSGTGTFVDFLAKKGHRVTLESGPSLSKTFGAAFSSMSVVQKNRYVLREMHPELLTAFNRGHLPPKVMTALEKMLAKDLIGTTNDLTRATIRIERELQSILSTNLDTLGELTSVLRMVRDPALRKSIFEAASHVKGFSPFKKLLDDNAELIAKISKETDDNVFDDLIRIGPIDDNDTMLRLIREKDFRNTLLEFPDAIKALKKCASPCFPPTATPDDIRNVGSMIQKIKKAGEDVDFTKLNEFLYTSRGKDFSQIVASLEAKTGDEIAAFFKGLKLSDLVIPAGMSSAKGLKGKLHLIIARGVSPKQLSAILKNLDDMGFDGMSAAQKLSRAAGKVQGKEMKHWSTLLNDLESTNHQTVEASLAVLEKLGRISKDGPKRIDAILSGLGRDPLGVISKGIQGGSDPTKWMNLLDDLFTTVTPSSQLKRFFGGMDPGNLAKVADLVDPKRLSKLVKDTAQPERVRELILKVDADRFGKFFNDSHATTLKNLIDANPADRLTKVLSQADTADAFTAKGVKELLASFGVGNFAQVEAALARLNKISELTQLRKTAPGMSQFTKMLDLFLDTGAQPVIARFMAFGAEATAKKFEGLSILLKRAQDAHTAIADQIAELTRIEGFLGKFGASRVADSYSPTAAGSALKNAGIDDIRVGHFQQRHTWEHFDFPNFRGNPKKPTTFFPDTLHTPAHMEQLAENALSKLGHTSPPALTGTHKIPGVTNPAPPPNTLDIAIHVNNNGGKFQMDMMYPYGPMSDLTRIPEGTMKGIEKFFP